jgi:hypothetical protein
MKRLACTMLVDILVHVSQAMQGSIAKLVNIFLYKLVYIKKTEACKITSQLFEGTELSHGHQESSVLALALLVTKH